MTLTRTDRHADLVAPGPPRPRYRRAEAVSLGVVAAAMVGFGGFGLATGAPSTVAYLVTVALVGALVVRAWTPDAPRLLAPGFAVMTVLHLAGGLVRVGHDVLYNASFASPALRYDHVAHAFGVLVGTIAVWALVARPAGLAWHGPGAVAVVVLAGLGLGALNETVEFLTTTLHHGSHVGGYTNTGWDLVSNVVGAVAAGRFLARHG